jgi:hypothetical protein
VFHGFRDNFSIISTIHKRQIISMKAQICNLINNKTVVSVLKPIVSFIINSAITNFSFLYAYMKQTLLAIQTVLYSNAHRDISDIDFCLYLH